jgi:hypothetical protein
VAQSCRERDVTETLYLQMARRRDGQALEVPVSTAYYHSSKRDDADLPKDDEAILLRFPFYGYRKLSNALQRACFPKVSLTLL